MWFRSWLLLFVLWSSFGHAQYVVDLAQAGPVEVPAGLHIDSVFAAFNDSASMGTVRSEEHTSELQSRENLVCRLLLEKKNGKSIVVVCQSLTFMVKKLSQPV